jgi:fumarylpyruvate hydrolase
MKAAAAIASCHRLLCQSTSLRCCFESIPLQRRAMKSSSQSSAHNGGINVEYVFDPPRIPTVPVVFDDDDDDDHDDGVLLPPPSNQQQQQQQQQQQHDKVFPVHRIYCVGRNYADHAIEMGGDPVRERPFFFLKPADAIVPCGIGGGGIGGTGTTTMIPYPSATSNLHYEVELVVAMSSATSVYGYAVGVDLTRRDLQTVAKQQARPWCSAKGFDRSAPIGAIRPLRRRRQQLDAILDTDDDDASASSQQQQMQHELWLRVNGIERQRSRPFVDMIWSVNEILSSLREQFDLTAGDLIFTGTPAGVGPLVVGDTVTAGLDGVGQLSFTMVAGAAAAEQDT